MCQALRVVPDVERSASSLLTMILPFDLQGSVGTAWNGSLHTKVSKRPEGDRRSPHPNARHIYVAVVFMGSPDSHPFIRCQADNWCLMEKETEAKTDHEM